MQSTILETLMYDIAQLFMLPVLILVAAAFLYAFWALGSFAMQAVQRARNRPGAGAGYPLIAQVHARHLHLRDDQELAAHKLMETDRIVTRVCPMLGLVATMIPMGPALKSLSDGQLAAVSQNLMIAFSAVILALIAASITFWIVNVRKRWLAEELQWLAAHPHAAIHVLAPASAAVGAAA